MPSSRSLLGDAAALLHLGQELFAFPAVAHRRAAAGRRPDRRHHRADLQVPRPDLVGQPPQFAVVGVDADVRIEEEQIEAVEPHAIDFGRGRQIEHRIQIDGRLAASPLPTTPGQAALWSLG